MTTDPRWRNALLLMLSCSAGCMDAVSYIELGNVFVANMTGHAVLLGIALVDAQGMHIALAAAAVVGFFAGAMLGSWAVESQPREHPWPATVTRSLWIESALLAAVAAVWAAVPDHTPALVMALILVSALAMGMQSAAARDLKVAGVSTTYLTGTMTSFAADVVTHLRGARAADKSIADRQAPALLGGVWLVYIVGATVGAYASRTAPDLAMPIPALITLAVAALAAWRYRR